MSDPLTMTPAQWLAALADAWDMGHEAGQVHSRGRLPKARQSANPYRTTPRPEPQPEPMPSKQEDK